jgi:hypothetical protein
VLRDAILTLKKFKPHVFVEVRSYNYEEFGELIKSLSYECRSLWGSHVDKVPHCYSRGIREEST